MDIGLLPLVLGFVIQTSYGSPDWDQLKVRFSDFTCDTSKGFFDLPRTEREAIEEGFQKLSDCSQGQSVRKWAGKRYRPQGNDEVIVIYDINGYIAGVQSGIPASPRNFMVRNRRGRPVIDLLTLYSGKYYITFYFMDPENICTVGRNELEFTLEGTGRGLFIQNGSRYNNVVEVPLDEIGLSSTNWNRGICLPIMGQHYRYGWSRDSQCQSLEPPFLMYNNGKLDGFGWTIAAYINSQFLEHPPVVITNMTPSCLVGREDVLTGLHFYLSDPCTRRCPSGQS